MTLDMLFFDVKHGSSTYIKTPNNKHLLHDLGSGSYSDGEEFSPILYLKDQFRKKGVEKLDKVIITHPHKDHIDDILNFRELNPRSLTRPRHIPKEKVMEGVKEEDKAIFEEYCRINENYIHPISPENNLQVPENAGGASIKTFIANSCSLSDFNSHSIVTLISYAESKILLTGDNNSCSWKELLKNEEFKSAIKDVDIFLAPHHGRESGWHSELFNHFKPKLTIVSDGKYINTSATERYSTISSGWTVHRRKDEFKQVDRKCVTTRNDGVIFVRLGYDNNNPSIYVTID